MSEVQTRVPSSSADSLSERAPEWTSSVAHSLMSNEPPHAAWRPSSPCSSAPGLGQRFIVPRALEGIAASSGAACAEGEPEPSFVLQAMGYEPEWGIGAVRFSLGHATTAADVDAVLEALPPIVSQLRAEG